MKLTDIKNSLNEISAIGGLKQIVNGNTDRVEGIKLSKEMAQAMIDWFNSSPYGRKYPKAAKARLHLSLGIMMSFGLDRYAKFKGAKEELKYIKDLSKAMRDNVNESKFAGWIAGYNGKQIEIKKGEAKDLYNAKLLAIKKLKVPKSKVGLMFIKPAVDESVNEIQYDDALAKFNKELEKNSEVKKAAKHYNKSVKDVVKVLQQRIKVNRYSDKSIKQISINYTEDGPLSSKVTIKASQNYKQNESVVNEGKDVGHYERVGNQTIVDSNFVNYSKGVLPNSELVHLGMGDFAIKSPSGVIKFQRSGKLDGIGQDFVGRPHRMTDDKNGKLVDMFLKLMLKKKKAVLSMSESVVNENKYSIIDPRGNTAGTGTKDQANKRVKQLGGSKKGYFVVPAKLALKARRAMEKYKFDFKNAKLQDILSDFYWESVEESVVNEAKYDIGMARKGNGITVYNRAEEENGDYKNVAHIDSNGKIKYYDKKVPSNIKKQLEAEAKKMMEITKEGTMKLKDILKESFQKGKVYSNPFHTPFVKENDDERREASPEMSNEQKQAFLEAVKSYKKFGESIYRKEGLAKVYESIRGLVEVAGKNMVKETEGSFDGITVGRHVKRMNESFKVFEKTLKEVGTLQQRLESTYDEIGEVLGKYYEINELEEGNEFGAARAKAIANGDSEFSVDGKTYPVKSVDKDDKENAKEFTNESKSMKLTSMLNESFGFGELPSSKLMKMKVSAKDMLDSVKNKTTKKIVEGYSTEEKRIVLLAVRKLMKYKNIDINLAAQYVVGAAEELKYDIDKGKVTK